MLFLNINVLDEELVWRAGGEVGSPSVAQGGSAVSESSKFYVILVRLLPGRDYATLLVISAAVKIHC